MRIEKYICDCCKKELDKEEIIVINIPSEVVMYDDGCSEIDYISIDLCGNCLPDIQDRVNKILSEMINNIKRN